MVVRARTCRLRAASAAALVLVLALAWSARPAVAALGSQRNGTSAGTFLKIGVGARSAAMGGASVAQTGEPTCLFRNPAGLSDLEDSAFMVERIEWLAGINMTAAGLASSLPWVGGVVGLSVLSLGTELAETTTLDPNGTGRVFTHRDLAFGTSYGRHLTDRFSFGITARYIYEALGTEIGGPSASSWVVDMGTTFNTGFQGVILAMSIESFGPDLTPSSSYVDPRPGAGNEVEFSGFAPPTTFSFGSSYRVWANPENELWLNGEFVRPADNDETMRFGGELSLYDRLDLRAGWDGGSDALPWSAGVGVHFGGETLKTHIDYAFSGSEYFDRVDRIGLRLEF